MEITTLIFFSFVFITAVIYYLIPKNYQWILLLIVSLIFFVANSAVLTLMMIASTAIIHFSGIVLENNNTIYKNKKKDTSKDDRIVLKEKFNKKQKHITVIAIVGIVSMLFFTKYINFLGNILNTVGSLFNVDSFIPVFNIILPLGISYYTLMSISYVVDVKRGVIKAERNPFRLLLYVCYFPHIVEGPFDRYNNLNSQFRTHHKFNINEFSDAIIIILFGLLKKLVVADRIGIYVSEYFEKSESNSLIGLGIATVMYTIQLYTDFSGCIDIVSGVSKLYGIKIAKNFRQPFFSKTVNEFWQRWHISLGEWLKEYVFYSVSLSNTFKKINKYSNNRIKNKHFASIVPLAYSLFFVWFIMGIWHGASVKYIVYGLYYYSIMMFGKLFEQCFDKSLMSLHIKKDNSVYKLIQLVRTFIIVNIGMLLFKSNTITEFINSIISALRTFKGTDLANIIPERKELIIAIFGILIVLIVDVIKEKGKSLLTIINNHCYLIKEVTIVVLLFIILLFGAYGVEYGEGAALYAQF